MPLGTQADFSGWHQSSHGIACQIPDSTNMSAVARKGVMILMDLEETVKEIVFLKKACESILR